MLMRKLRPETLRTGVVTMQVATNVALGSGVVMTSSFRKIGDDVHVRTSGSAEVDRAPTSQSDIEWGHHLRRQRHR
jgi:hypothetical protein